MASTPLTDAALNVDDLHRITDVLFDQARQLLRRCRDADVTFVPVDPAANDPEAVDSEDVHKAWTLAHIVLHMTSTAEELAALAAEVARGVTFHGRSRYEVPWQQATTVAQCRARLKESHRQVVASLGMWPAQPHLDNTFAFVPGGLERGPIACYLLGLHHNTIHLEHLRNVIGQARAYRRQQTLLGRWRRRLRTRFGGAAQAAAGAR